MKRLGIILAVSCMVLAFAASVALAFPAVEVYKKTSKSVVLIVSGEGGSENMLGAGSVISSNGYIITNAHVVINKGTGRPYSLIRVFIKPDEVTGELQRDLVNRHSARVVVYNVKLDLALVKADDLPHDVKPIAFSSPRDIAVGEEVVAIGHPEQGGLWSLTYGRISGQIIDQGDVKGKNVYQTDTSMNRGNSGGPLLDSRGYIVGVNTNIARLGEGNLPITGVNFALQSRVVKHWLDSEGYKVAYGTSPLYQEAVPVSNTQTGTPPAAETKSAPAKPVESAEPARTEPKAETHQAEPASEPAMTEPAKAEPTSEPSITEPAKAEPAKEPETTSPKTSEEGKMAQGKDEFKSDEMLTPKRPYSSDDLFQAVERDMENMMDEMRQKIRQHR